MKIAWLILHIDLLLQEYTSNPVLDGQVLQNFSLTPHYTPTFKKWGYTGLDLSFHPMLYVMKNSTPFYKSYQGSR